MANGAQQAAAPQTQPTIPPPPPPPSSSAPAPAPAPAPTNPEIGKHTIQTLSARVKSAYPDGVTSDGQKYYDLDDTEMVRRVIGAHPIYQTWLSTDALQQLDRQLNPSPTFSSTAKEIMGDMNNALSQGAGRNLGEIGHTIKEFAKDPFWFVTSRVQDMVDAQNDSIARYSPDTDLGKRALVFVPFVGPTMASTVESLENKRFAEAGRTAGGALLQTAGAAAVPEVMKEVRGGVERAGTAIESRNVTKGTELYKKGLGIPSPPEAADLASKTAPDEINSARNADIVVKDVAKISREHPLTQKGSAASFQHARDILDYAKNLWETEHQAPIARNANLQVGFGPDGDPQVLVKAAREAITPEALDAEKNPAAAKRNAERWITQALDKPRSLSSLDQYIRELNADLESPRAKQQYGPLDIRMKNAVVKAARGEVERLLTNAGETGVKGVNSRYGALVDIADHAIDQGLAEAKTERTANPLLDWAHSYVFAHRTGLTGGISLNPAKLLTPTPSKMLTKGMAKLGRTSLEPPPASPGPFIPTPPGNVPLGPERPPNYQPPTTQATPVGPPPPPAGFPPTEPVARGPQWEPTPRSSQPQTNLWNLSPDVTRPGGQGGLPPTVAPPSGMVAQEFRKLGLSELVTPRQSTTLETMMRGPRWRDFDRNERLDAIRAVLHPPEDFESMVTRRPTGRLPEPPTEQFGSKEGVPLDREERQRRYRRMTRTRKEGE